jgi:hypothetical protein
MTHTWPTGRSLANLLATTKRGVYGSTGARRRDALGGRTRFATARTGFLYLATASARERLRSLARIRDRGPWRAGYSRIDFRVFLALQRNGAHNAPRSGGYGEAEASDPRYDDRGR